MTATPPTQAAIERWLIERIALLVDQPADRIDPDLPLEACGVTSVMAVGLSADLEDWLGIVVEATIVWDHPTAARLSAHLAAACAGRPG